MSNAPKSTNDPSQVVLTWNHSYHRIDGHPQSGLHPLVYMKVVDHPYSMNEVMDFFRYVVLPDH